MAIQAASDGVTLVLGATGKTGRRVAERLINAGRAVRLGSRRATPPFEWNDPATWTAAVAGIDSVYVSFQPDLAVPGAVDTVAAFFRVTEQAGVRKVVLLSGRGEHAAEEVENALKAASFDWTILRCSWFAQNFSESVFLEPILSGTVALPADTAPEPFVDVDDIAEIAVAAFTDARHACQLYEITGPTALTLEEAVAEIARATNRVITYEEVPPSAYRDALIAHGVAPVEVELMMYLFTEVMDGRNRATGDGVERALGREPRSFTSYVQATVNSGVWRRRDA
jgi:uncharacterized protein YbjT (DUF2867 family)